MVVQKWCISVLVSIVYFFFVSLCQVADYLACDWRGTLEITKDMEEFKAIAMDTDVDPDNNNKHLSLSVHFNLTETCNLYIYSPYWIVNKTDLTFQIRVSDK